MRVGWVALLFCLTVHASPVAADEFIARRLGALRALVSPREVAKLPPAGQGRCPDAEYWGSARTGTRSRTDRAIVDASRRYTVDKKLIRSVIRHESAGDLRAVSHKGAMGLMQLMPGTARELGVTCPFDPRQNVLGGTRYLRLMRNRLGSWPRAIAAYHCGPGCVESGRIPKISRNYARRVLQTWRPGRYQRVRF